MSNLTKFQEQLITDIQKEFTKLNTKEEINSKGKKFTLATIEDCINEEVKFIDIIKKHNEKMIAAFSKMMLKEIKDFNKEFGKVIELKYEFTKYENSKGGLFSYMVENNKKSPENEYKSYETILYFVSKVKFNRGNDRWNFFNNADYRKYYLDFKREVASITLESGKKVQLYKIIGAQYLTKDWLNRGNGKKYDSLDEMLQRDDEVQRAMVQLVQK
jgi:hypothetical protein